MCPFSNEETDVIQGGVRPAQRLTYRYGRVVLMTAEAIVAPLTTHLNDL
ncbi:hypothetical protein J2Y00_003458 [Deinococcus soli (ex Cha et al. 2016)]|uniref:Uncharacterized protein n=2 Tax=Deinococcus soli (ex Cha et al. 2016) TaxID=1309411 RepID=A0ACC6KJQ6_9DEIO|nr:hypothetical protein [Deinococcus soli (ex Cha et al. 2016)]MDR6329891.1 hypothetical protein [Deinococcus soli (ex Cha et al. 2016)]MDR6752758.1 hypothetical protein [Deinococcus soli (ex Cha et al. 2016)]